MINKTGKRLARISSGERKKGDSSVGKKTWNANGKMSQQFRNEINEYELV